MNKNKAILAIAVTVSFRGAIYKLTFSNVLRWLFPIAILSVRLIPLFHHRHGP